MYKIKTIDNIKDIDRGNIAPINIYNWGCEYRPVSYAILCFVKDQGIAANSGYAANQGFAVKLWSEEIPVATFDKPNSMVCKDSCLEFFCDFKPSLDKGYINFEGNAKGCILAEFGKHDSRRFLLDMGLYNPTAIPFSDEKSWGYTMFIPLDLIEKAYGNAEFKPGDIVNGSFFKCGDETGKPHYGSFAKIDWEYPSFHRPQFFEQMMIEG